MTLRTRGRVQSVAEFGDIVVRQRDGHAILLRDVATVEDSMADAETKASLNGEPTVLVTVRRQSGTNTVQVVEAVNEKLADLAPLVPPGYEIRVVRDMSEFIKASIKSVEEHLIFGSILAAAVVLVFLWNWRSTIIAAIAIPTSIIATFGLIWYQGFTLNSMTMLALTLAVGIVIDDAIVVLENIYRFVEEKGRPPAQAAVDLRASRIHGWHRRPLHDELRLHDVVRDPGVAARQLHADADARRPLDQDEAAPRRRRRP
jgi:HAE1 family hydrophobic/amphiphilic exporter-1